ncbi:putative reverse transcriptase domain-containing protein [Tanacetum coccineum]
MDQKLKGYALRNAENKRRLENNQRDNRGQQPPHKRQNTRGHNNGGQRVARAYTASSNENRGYTGPHPFCDKCRIHHVGQCIVRCRRCHKVGHVMRDCKSAPTAPVQGGPVANQRGVTCYECRAQG